MMRVVDDRLTDSQRIALAALRAAYRDHNWLIAIPVRSGTAKLNHPDGRDGYLTMKGEIRWK